MILEISGEDAKYGRVVLERKAAIACRRARIEELPQAATFWLAMMEEIGKHRESDFPSGWREAFVRYFERRIAAGEAAYFVAEADGKLVASAAAITRDGYPAEIHGIADGYVLGVYALPPYRGRGLGTELTKLTLEFLRERKVSRIRLHASPFGRKIYEGLGFAASNEMVLWAMA